MIHSVCVICRLRRGGIVGGICFWCSQGIKTKTHEAKHIASTVIAAEAHARKGGGEGGR